MMEDIAALKSSGFAPMYDEEPEGRDKELGDKFDVQGHSAKE